LRPLRATVDDARSKLRIQCGDPTPLPTLRREVELLVGLLRAVQKAAAAAAACPRPHDAENMAKSGSPDSFADLQRDFEDAIKRNVARQNSRNALTRLSRWFEPQWIAACETEIAHGRSNQSKLDDIVCAVGTLQSYQRFRSRVSDLDPAAMEVFSILREREQAFRETPADNLEDYVRNTIHREALLAWKGRLETTCPALLAEKEELQRKVETLAELDGRLRELNRQLLSADVVCARFCASLVRRRLQRAWENSGIPLSAANEQWHDPSAKVRCSTAP
jgi:primosomal replication protein N''